MIFFKSKKTAQKQKVIEVKKEMAKKTFNEASEELTSIVKANGFHLQLYRAINPHDEVKS